MQKNNLKYFNIYFLISIFYYCFGRYKWNIPSYFNLLIYLFICYFCLNVGYRLSWKGSGKFSIGLSRNYISSEIKYKNIRKLFWISSICLIVFQIVWVIVFFDQFNILNVFSVLGDNYYARLETTFDTKIPIMQIRTLFWGVTLFAYPIGFLCYKQLPIIDKILLYLTMSIDILAALNMGVSKNLGDIIIIYLGVFLLKNITNISKKRLNQSYKKIFKIFVALISFLMVFNLIQNLRNEVSTGNIYNPYRSFALIRDNNIFYLMFGENSSLSLLIDKIGTYISHAYTGLAYALEIPFKNTYLLGFSRSLMEYGEQYFGMSLQDITYNARIDYIYGWLDGQWWPTAFTWIGNAVSLWGVPAIMLILGIFIRYLEDDYGKSKNIFTAVLYVQMIVTLIYLPCNMQIFQSRASLMGSLLLFLMFFLRKKKLRIFLRER